ncbi:MAG: hypothetical protein WCJ40_15485 [Planctomycetota bacterium]
MQKTITRWPPAPAPPWMQTPLVEDGPSSYDSWDGIWLMTAGIGIVLLMVMIWKYRERLKDRDRSRLAELQLRNRIKIRIGEEALWLSSKEIGERMGRLAMGKLVEADEKILKELESFEEQRFSGQN